MTTAVTDAPEFTDEQLRDVLTRIGQEARRAAFAAGQPITFARNGTLVRQYPDGHEETLGPLNGESQFRDAP